MRRRCARVCEAQHIGLISETFLGAHLRAQGMALILAALC